MLREALSAPVDPASLSPRSARRTSRRVVTPHVTPDQVQLAVATAFLPC